MKQKLLLTITLWLALLGSAWAQNNNSLHFDGIDDYMPGPEINSTTFTLEAWVYPTALGKDQAIISTLSESEKDGMELHIGPDNIPVITVRNGNEWLGVKGKTIVAANKWTHIAATYDGTNVSIYVNGVLEKSTKCTHTIGSKVHVIGRRSSPGGLYFNGRIDEVRIWSTARTQTQIVETMTSIPTGSDLLVYYNFNVGTAGGNNKDDWFHYDNSGNRRNSALNNFALTGETSNWVEGYTITHSASPAEIVIERTSGSRATFNIISNTSWSIVDAADWLDLEVTSGTGTSVINLTTNEANTTGAPRSIQLVIAGDNVDDATVTVIQKTKSISASQDQLKIGIAEGSTATFDVLANVDWSITGIPDWLSLSQETGTGNTTITVTALNTNTTVAERLATLTIAGVDVTMPINVNVVQTPQHSVTITKTDASVIASSGTSLQEAIGTMPLAEVQKLEITAGAVTASDWQWISNNRGSLSSLTHFTITDGITEVSTTRAKFNKTFNSNIEHVSIYGITEIQFEDFKDYNKLKSVSFPDVTTIGDKAFSNCKALGSINSPLVTNIGYNAFSSCTALSSVDFPLVTNIGYSAFASCYALTSIDFPLVTSIESGTFSGCTSLISAKIPLATSIGVYAFNKCNVLAEASFPLVTSIETYTFNECNSLTSVNFPLATSVGSYAFYKCEKLSSISIPLVTSIGESAFSYCKLLGSADFPLVKSIGVQAFNKCTALTSASFPLATNIEPYTFYECNNLSSVHIPLATSIGDYAFSNCFSLTSANFPLVNSIGSHSFINGVALTSANFPLVTSVGTAAFYNCQKLNSISIPIVTSIGEHAFYSCLPLSSISIPLATSIGDYAFSGCLALKDIILGATPPYVFSVNSFNLCPETRYLTIANATGSELTDAYAAYKAAADDNTTDNLWYGWQIENTVERQAISADAVFAGGGHSLSPTGLMPIGVTIPLSAAPAVGYIMVPGSLAAHKTGDASTAVSIVNNAITVPAFDVTVTAEFEGLPQVLTLETVANGTITATPSEGIVTDTEITLTTTPAAGYKLVENSLRAYKTGDESVTVSIVDGKFTMPAFDVTVTAEFEALPQTLTVATVANGTITATPSEGIVTDTEISLTTNPSAGYKLVENSLRAYKTGDESVTVSIADGKFTMPAFDVTVTAEFEALPQVLTVETVNNGTITATPNEGIVTDTEITLTTTPAEGYKLIENSLRAYKTGDESVVVAIVDGKIAMPAFAVTVTAEFEGLPQVLALETLNNGTITATPNNGIVTGTEITLTTTPANGYKLVENSLRAYKTGDESVVVEIVNGKIIMPAYDVAVTAQFELQPYTVSVDANIVNGTLAATPSENVTMGTEVTLTVTPTTGYQLVENSLRAYKTGDETVTVTIVDNKFAMPAFAVTVTAEFEGLPQVLAIATVANGTITATPSEGIVTDTEVTLSTTPAEGYKLVENSLRAYKTGDESVAVAIVDGKFTMPAYDVTVTAEFEALPQTLTVATVANGTITATPNEGIVTDTEITLTTTPAEGYKLVENSLRAYKTGDESVAVAIVDGKFTMPAYDVTVTAEFEALPQTLTVATVANGTITATPSEGIVTDTEITLSSTPVEGYKLTENSLRAYKTGDESVTVSIVDGKFTMPAYDVTVTAQFEALPQVLTVEAVNNGTITATPSEGIVTDTEITLSTTPAEGYKLIDNSLRAYKTGDESVTVSIVDGKFTMPAYDVTVTAEFEALPQVLTMATVANGTITATPSVGIVTDTEITLSTTPAAGYKLTENSLRAYKTGDESVTVEIVDGKFTMPAYDVTVTAQFELIPAATYSVTVASGITNGTLTVEPSTNVAAGAEVMLTATPSSGYRLKEGRLKAHKTGDESVTVSIVDGKFTMPAFDVTVTCQFELITGIDDNTAATISAYPNPFTDYLVIESEEQIRSVSFINLLGKTVQHTSMPQAQISTQNLLPGIYLVKVDFAKGKPVVIRMVKQ